MNFKQINQQFREGEFIFKPATKTDKLVIEQIFQDDTIKRFYIVSKEALRDYKRLVDYWINNNTNSTGICWIIYKRGNKIFSANQLCGFIDFKIIDSHNNVKISYAVLSNYSNMGVGAFAISTIITKLKGIGVKRVDIEVYADNLTVEQTVKGLGFTTNKQFVFVSSNVIGTDNTINLWRKYLIDFDQSILEGKIPCDTSVEQIIPIIQKVKKEIEKQGQHPNLSIRYYYLLGRIKYLEGNFDEATSAFEKCNMITLNEGLPDIYENYYWFAKMEEAEGNCDNCFSPLKSRTGLYIKNNN